MTGFDLRGAQAIVTGASSGIGRDLAVGLAAAGCDVLLVARREDRLRALADELREARGVRADECAVDLAAPGGTELLVARASALGRPVDVLVQSAGLGRHGPFVGQDHADEQRMVAVNVAALTSLTRAFVPGMVERGRGAVLLVGSTAPPTIASRSTPPRQPTTAVADSSLSGRGIAP